MIKEINALLKDGVKNGHFPGVAYCIVYSNGKRVCKHLGYKRLFPYKELNHGDEIYDVASLTKVISTTTMIMKLIEEKKLSLETKIYTILSRLKHEEITVYDLLTHSSGLPADISRASTLKNREEVLDRIYGMNLIYKKNEHIVYSDVGFILLGLVIENITQMNLDQYAKLVIFDPLDMKDTSYHPDILRSAPTELRNDDVYQGYLTGFVHDEKAFAMGGLSGHAGLFSTTHDIAKFILAILENKFVLNKETLDMLFPLREKKTHPDGNLLHRALGWDKPSNGGTAGDYVSFDDTIVHTGFTGCNIFIDRKHQVGFVMLSNAVHPKRNHNGIISYRNKIGNMIVKGGI